MAPRFRIDPDKSCSKTTPDGKAHNWEGPCLDLVCGCAAGIVLQRSRRGTAPKTYTCRASVLGTRRHAVPYSTTVVSGSIGHPQWTIIGRRMIGRWNAQAQGPAFCCHLAQEGFTTHPLLDMFLHPSQSTLAIVSTKTSRHQTRPRVPSGSCAGTFSLLGCFASKSMTRPVALSTPKA